MNEVQRLVHENQQLKMQLEQQKQQLNSSNRLFQELFPKSQLKSLPEKIEQLKTQFQNMEEKCYKTERILEHAQSISDSKEKINKQLKEQIVQLQKKLDSKDIELLKMSKSVRNVNQSMIPTFNESVVIKIHDRSLQQNIEYIQSQIALLNIPNANTHIDEILTIISDIIYGNGFKELQQHFRIKASDFSRFKDKMQANWQTEYDQILQQFLQNKCKNTYLNQYEILIDEQNIGIGTQLAVEILTGLCIGYEFGGNSETPCIQNVENGNINKIPLGIM
ncbi:Conserved_hypothetical protein [Hexamita inflata]|uniref:Uncharacterized protein n=1 Tax=Hexamita inflata TaxID=28002 RepID=A0AA86PXS8_9EUKA|nr:Conserved hypothetical protein [Hexamita inflata]